MYYIYTPLCRIWKVLEAPIYEAIGELEFTLANSYQTLYIYTPLCWIWKVLEAPIYEDIGD